MISMYFEGHYLLCETAQANLSIDEAWTQIQILPFSTKDFEAVV